VPVGIFAPWHWVTLIAIIVVLFVGHERLPALGRALGRAVRNFMRAWKGIAQEPSLTEESRPKRRPAAAKAPSRQSSPSRPVAASGTIPLVRLLRFLLRSQRRRKLVFWSLLVLGIACVAALLADGFFSTSSFRAKAVAFLVLFVVGCVLLVAYRLSQRRGGKASSRPRG
jgi:TatA/E family protein of Tat protein translocase